MHPDGPIVFRQNDIAVFLDDHPTQHLILRKFLFNQFADDAFRLLLQKCTEQVDYVRIFGSMCIEVTADFLAIGSRDMLELLPIQFRIADVNLDQDLILVLTEHNVGIRGLGLSKLLYH